MAIANWTCVSWVAYAPGTIAVNVTWTEREFNAGQTPCNMYPSIFNRFPVIQAVKSKVRNFSTFFAHFGLPWIRSCDHRGNVTWIEREFNACQTPRSIYASIFNHFWDIASDWLSRVRILLLTRDIDIPILSVCPSVRLSVCPWHAGIVWKRLNISS